ncbi:hypothetical protein [Kingella sp. (in: b-proteobacteria)]|nr:hypothetical protein [Kingella sp. (in: b-proteobacteria)]MDO4657297.1 hypothetical protein [Kingella sp. (in: b-proteobacteria)]
MAEKAVWGGGVSFRLPDWVFRLPNYAHIAAHKKHALLKKQGVLGG